MTQIRAAIYARYSSDLQSDKSIEDQIRLLDEYAAAQGWVISNHYTDHAISGASLIRPGIQMLLDHAQQRDFDVILSEGLDRLSRDQEDIAGIYKRAKFSDVNIFTLAEGEISELHIGLKGTMNALFLKDLAKKTHRGLRGRVEAGKSAGGKSFGYDIVKKFDANGEPIRGDRIINKDEAAIVNRIYSEYLAGHSPQTIAKRLNKEGIPGPTAKGWGPSTIYGNRERGTGILNNELYIGRLVWNRLRYVKDPSTGKRISRMNPENEWIITELPELRLVEQAQWETVKTKQGKIASHKTLGNKRRPKNLFSFLIKCGVCGGGCSMISQSHYGCSTARNKGTCNNLRSVKQETLEQSVLSTMQHHLMDEQLTQEFVREYTRHMNEMHISHNAALRGYQSELKRIDTKLSKMVDAIADGAPVAPLKDKMHELVARQTELNNILESMTEEPVLFHPNIAGRFHDEIKRLLNLFNQEDHRTEASTLLRSLIEKIVLTPKDNDEKGVTIDLFGDLAGILGVATKGDKPLIKDGLSYFNQLKKQATMVAGGHTSHTLCKEFTKTNSSQGTMVAGVGFEPTTFRL